MLTIAKSNYIKFGVTSAIINEVMENTKNTKNEVNWLR